MEEPLAIAKQLIAILEAKTDKDSFEQDAALTGKTVLITAGPTIEPIDPVRYISNHSSDKMGYALARAAESMGANVVLISGPVSLAPPNGVAFVSVQTASEMLHAVKQHIRDCDLFIGCAAVADYTPVNVADQKIKKSEEAMQINLIKNPDIIAWVAEQNPRPIVVGFAAESQNLREFAAGKLKRKSSI